MNKPDIEKEKEAYEFFRSRLGKFINITEERAVTDENEAKKDDEEKPLQKLDLKNSHKSGKK